MTSAIHHVRHGRGPELLLLHGLGGSSGSWAPIFDALASHRTLIALDLPGFGQSPPLQGEVSLHALADAAIDFLAAHRLTGIDAAGSSMGAQLVLELARRRAVGRVVSLNPGGFWSPAEQRVFFLSMAASMGLARRLAKFLPALIGNPVTRTMFLAQFSPRPWRLPPKLVLDEIRRYLAAASFDEMLRALAHARPQQGMPSDISNSIVIGWGRSDRICFPRQAHRALAAFPNARIHWFDRCGHFPHWDAPEETIKLILQATG
jgi:pimeloyl-ACP methyl ester carboxylesterase